MIIVLLTFFVFIFLGLPIGVTLGVAGIADMEGGITGFSCAGIGGAAGPDMALGLGGAGRGSTAG